MKDNDGLASDMSYRDAIVAIAAPLFWAVEQFVYLNSDDDEAQPRSQAFAVVDAHCLADAILAARFAHAEPESEGKQDDKV